VTGQPILPGTCLHCLGERFIRKPDSPHAGRRVPCPVCRPDAYKRELARLGSNEDACCRHAAREGAGL